MVGSDPVSGFTVSVVTRLNRITELMASVAAFGPAAADAAADGIEEIIKRNCPVDLGELRDSVTKEQIGPDSYAVGPTAYYAPYVNYGTGPHVPNTERVGDWAGRHGFDPSELISHIAENGTAANPFMEASAEEAQGMGIDLFFDKVSFGLVGGVI